MKYEIIPLTEEEEALIEQKINAYADTMAPPEPHTAEEQLVFKVEGDEGNIIGGCVVNIHAWGRAVLAQLWVDGRYRRHGIGSILIRAAENAAREKGCYYLCLATVDYMARPLYEKHGFRVFTVNRDIPRGHEGWSMSKRLDKGVEDYIPTDNTAAGKYQVVRGSKEDAEIIRKGLSDFAEEFVPSSHEWIPLSRKLVDENGDLIAAVVCGVNGEDSAWLDGVWVEEPYRGQGIGSRLCDDAGREAKEKGAYVILTYCCDWVAGFFFRNGFTARGQLEDYPKGHTGYELEKRI